MWLQNRVSEILSSIYCKMKSVLLFDNAIPILSYFGLYKIVKTRFWSLMVDHNEDQSYLIDSDNTHSYMNSIKPIIVRG